MSELVDIKDMTPNQDLVEALEVALKQAKSGELRSMLYAKQWSNQAVSHGWNRDHRGSYRMMLAELVMLQHEIVVNLQMHEQESILYLAIEGD